LLPERGVFSRALKIGIGYRDEGARGHEQLRPY
jgi:hypothetical protein